MVVLGGGISNVVWEWIVPIEDECVHDDCFGVFNSY